MGDTLHIRNDVGLFVVEVLGLSDMRGPMAVAQALFRETEASREARAQAAAERKSMAHRKGTAGILSVSAVETELDWDGRMDPIRPDDAKAARPELICGGEQRGAHAGTERDDDSRTSARPRHAPKLTHPGPIAAAAKLRQGSALSFLPAVGGWVTFGVHSRANSRARRRPLLPVQSVKRRHSTFADQLAL